MLGWRSRATASASIRNRSSRSDLIQASPRIIFRATRRLSKRLAGLVDDTHAAMTEYRQDLVTGNHGERGPRWVGSTGRIVERILVLPGIGGAIASGQGGTDLTRGTAVPHLVAFRRFRPLVGDIPEVQAELRADESVRMTDDSAPRTISSIQTGQRPRGASSDNSRSHFGQSSGSDMGGSPRIQGVLAQKPASGKSFHCMFPVSEPLEERFPSQPGSLARCLACSFRKAPHHAVFSYMRDVPASRQSCSTQSHVRLRSQPIEHNTMLITSETRLFNCVK